MKKTVTVTLLIASGVLITANLFSSASGAPKVTSAPNEGNCTQCHIGSINPAGGSAAITITGNPSSYVPGQTYEINMTVNYTGRSKFGFALSAKNTNNNDVGTFSTNGNNAVQVVSNYVTHSFSGTTGSTNSKTWSFNWIAPATNVGNIKFYASANAANGNTNETGDFIYTTNTTLNAGTVGINEVIAEQTFAVYPNPVTDHIILSYELKDPSVITITLHDMTGKKMETLISGALKKGSYNSRFDLTGVYAKGLYFINIQKGDHHLVKKLFIQ